MKLTCIVVFALMVGSVAAQEPKTASAAELYESGLNDLMGSAQYRDESRGIDRIRRAAQQGYAPAQTAAAFYAETPQQAFEWCKKAALQGDVLGEWCVGDRYFAGNGVDRNITEAEKWLRKAADAGIPFAAYSIGLIKLDRDPKSAPQWFQQAADQGLPQAQRKLAAMLIDGTRIAKDKYRAYVWLLVADLLDSSPSVNEATLESELGIATTNKAKEEARSVTLKVSRATTAHGCTGWDGEFDPNPAFPPPTYQRYCR